MSRAGFHDTCQVLDLPSRFRGGFTYHQTQGPYVNFLGPGDAQQDFGCAVKIGHRVFGVLVLTKASLAKIAENWGCGRWKFQKPGRMDGAALVDFAGTGFRHFGFLDTLPLRRLLHCEHDVAFLDILSGRRSQYRNSLDDGHLQQNVPP